MIKTSTTFLALAIVLTACQPTPRTYTFQEAQEICAEEKRDAEGPRGEVTLGATSKGAGFGGVSVSVNDKYIRGVDPAVVYEQCMQKMTIQE